MKTIVSTIPARPGASVQAPRGGHHDVAAWALVEYRHQARRTRVVEALIDPTGEGRLVLISALGGGAS